MPVIHRRSILEIASNKRFSDDTKELEIDPMESRGKVELDFYHEIHTYDIVSTTQRCN